MLTELEHIGIAVEQLDQSIELWLKLTGGRLVHRETTADQLLEIAVIEIGALRIELLHSKHEDSPIARFIRRHGPGIHHIALHSTAAQQDLERLRAAGFRLVDETPRAGADNSLIGFVHPRDVGGVLVEVVESCGDQAQT